MKKADIFARIMDERRLEPRKKQGAAFAPSNIALCKYWGKRDDELNLPVTSSLSISLGRLGTRTTIAASGRDDAVFLNGKRQLAKSDFARGVTQFLNHARRGKHIGFRVDTVNTIPTAAGLASSASGFAALAMALDDLCGWQLSKKELSILARLGSGSASRSIFKGFAEWRTGSRKDGMDSYAVPLRATWPSLRVGLLTVSAAKKAIGSRAAMKRTVETSPLYANWPATCRRDLALIKTAISKRDFPLLGRTAESNALTMHATSLGAWPPVLFWLPESVTLMHRIWTLREAGLQVYFTMDAGPNIKLLFQARDVKRVKSAFPRVKVIKPFS